MQYGVQFQYRPRNNDRPYDYGQSFPLSSKDDVLHLPIIGDHVQMNFPEDQGLDGVVENRLFLYVGSDSGVSCIINIVVTDSDVPPGRLIKE